MGDMPMAFPEQLQRFARRANAVTFVRHAALCGFVVLAGAAGLRLTDHLLTPAFLAGSIAGALVIACGLAFRRRADLRQTAQAIDMHGGFDNCVTTALQFAGTADPVARLIVRDAQSCLQRIHPSSVFPLRVDVSARLLGEVAAAVLVAFALGTMVSPQLRTTADSRGTATDLAGASVDPADARTGTPRPAANPVGGTPQVRALQTPAAAAQTGVESIAGPDSTTAIGARSPDGDSHSPKVDSPAPSANQRELGADNQQRGTGTGTPASASLKRDEAPGAATPAVNGRGAGAGAGQSPRDADARAGGVRGGAVNRSAGAASSPSATARAGYTNQYRTAAAGAEQALEREQVPAPLRDAVRAYFTAIRP